jgi:hypothetical protein
MLISEEAVNMPTETESTIQELGDRIRELLTPVDSWSLHLNTNKGQISFRVGGRIPSMLQQEIQTESRIHGISVVFASQSIFLSPIDQNHPSVVVYFKVRPLLLEEFTRHDVETFFMCLLESNHGPRVVIGSRVNDDFKSTIVNLLRETILQPYFTTPIEEFQEETKLCEPAPLRGRQIQLQPGCSVGHDEITASTGTLGCILTDGEREYGLTAGHIILQNPSTEVYTGRPRYQMNHPSHTDKIVEKSILQRIIAAKTVQLTSVKSKGKKKAGT